MRSSNSRVDLKLKLVEIAQSQGGETQRKFTNCFFSQSKSVPSKNYKPNNATKLFKSLKASLDDQKMPSTETIEDEEATKTQVIANQNLTTLIGWHEKKNLSQQILPLSLPEENLKNFFKTDDKVFSEL